MADGLGRLAGDRKACTHQAIPLHMMVNVESRYYHGDSIAFTRDMQGAILGRGVRRLYIKQA